MIKGGTNELDLVRKDNLWRVKQRNDYPANFSEISGFLLKAADLKAAQTEEVGPSHVGPLQAAAAGAWRPIPPFWWNCATRRARSIKSLLLGKTHMRKADDSSSPMGDMGDSEGWPDGRYVMVGTGAKPWP